MSTPVSPNAYLWLELCPETVCWQPLTGRNNYAQPIYGAVQTFPGRRSFKQTRVASYERGTKGQGPENISESQIWILAVLNIGYEDLIYILGDQITGPNGQYIVPPILSIGRVPDEIGDLYTKCYLGSSNG